MSSDDNLEIDELLAGARLAGAQYDEIQRRVLAQVVSEPKRRWWPAMVGAPLWLGGAAALASAFGVWLVISGSGSTSVEPTVTPPASFTEKGIQSGTEVPGPGVDFQLRCATPTGACRLGDTLMFSVRGGAEGGYLGAYAVRVNEPGAVPSVPERIWYFPSASGVVPRLEARADTIVIREGVRLAAPHAPGRYEVTLWRWEVFPEPNTVSPPAAAKLTRLALEITD
jgi:hypothetical protein